MADTLVLQQVICPSCKQVISSFSPFQAEVECPYCHNRAFNPLITAKKVPVPERIIVFKTREEDFEQALSDSLVRQNYVPTDIFQSINPGNVIKAYLPMYLYEGRYQSSWSCRVAIEQNELRASSSGDSVKNKTVKRFVPYTGTSQGNFAFLCLAYEGKDIPEELRSFSKQFPYNVMASRDYDPALLGIGGEDSPMTLALDCETDITWNKYGDGMVNQLAAENAKVQLRGEEVENFRASNSYELYHNGRYVLAPFWFVYYTYNNRKFYFIMDGLGEKTSMTYPVNQEEVEYVNRKERLRKIYWWLWVLAPIVLYFSNFTVGAIVLALWFVVKIFVNKITDKLIEERLDASRAARREGASKLK